MKYSEIFMVFLAILIAGCTNFENLQINDNLINIEVVDTPEERAQGLMFRESLGYDSGMLFVYDNEDYRSFWMKNTLIPLDMIFISEDKIIIDLKEGFQPCKEDPCAVYTSKEEAKSVLEVNSGYVRDKGIKIGDEVEF